MFGDGSTWTTHAFTYHVDDEDMIGEDQEDDQKSEEEEEEGEVAQEQE